MSARRGTRVAIAVLAALVALAIGAPLLPLSHPATFAPARADHAPDPAWVADDPASLSRLADAHPSAFALRRAVFGDHVVRGALGADRLGRDLLARLVWGARVSFAVGLIATLVSVVLGVSWGAIAGFVGGRVDTLMMRVVDALDAVPLMFVVILVVAVTRGASEELRALGIDRELLLYAAIGAVSWLTMARVVRGQVLRMRGAEFVIAARAAGVPAPRILRRHLLPNLGGVVAVYLTLTIPRVVLTEAFLSFLGLGVEPPSVSWGTLAAEGLQSLTPVSATWWLAVFPGLALALTLGCLNVVGDALRDRLDPRLVRRG